MRRAARNHGGFTLIEVLVALAVLGISLVVLLRLVSGTLRLERTAHDYSRALAVAQARIDELSLEETPTTRAGQDEEFRWWVTASPVWEGGDQVTLYHVSVVIERPQARPLRFETLRVGAGDE
ncbi:MAG: prepilin-type N-terminal cleavage/methylation domain-containing protein [Candidatus Methylomirabilia bacterium]